MWNVERQEKQPPRNDMASLDRNRLTLILKSSFEMEISNLSMD